jgi:S-adenosylmethionine:tRNA ribosyltransferase-isomerase
VWEVLARPSHRLRPGGILVLAPGARVTLGEPLGGGRWLLEGPPGVSMVSLMEAYGSMPLPPYIRSYPDDPESYQTVYGHRCGSAAAPTAGLHFTPELLAELKRRGIGSTYITLHVGIDTFLPIREETVEDHRIHTETWAATGEALDGLRRTRTRGGRLVAVGTTATRVLETIARQGLLEEQPVGREGPDPADAGGQTQIFITPGHRFRGVDALLTNFHLPRSTVLALTMAFAGVERLRAAYEEAIGLGYRFFSFGDAMLIDRPDGLAAAER